MTIFLLSIILLFVYMTSMFLLALWLQDNSIVDVAYGLAFVLLGWTGMLLLGEKPHGDEWHHEQQDYGDGPKEWLQHHVSKVEILGDKRISPCLETQFRIICHR